MFLDDGNLPVLPDWEQQIQELEEIVEEGEAAEAEATDG